MLRFGGEQIENRRAGRSRTAMSGRDGARRGISSCGSSNRGGRGDERPPRQRSSRLLPQRESPHLAPIQTSRSRLDMSGHWGIADDICSFRAFPNLTPERTIAECYIWPISFAPSANAPANAAANPARRLHSCAGRRPPISSCIVRSGGDFKSVSLPPNLGSAR
jgi:hypothetical protein